ncbi:transcriptional regulator [Actinoplanes sp. NBRC 14428]|uniref:Transcriptional regulator with XRE-family HTH domain n=1 Tax=Pseudosporangium ferrugineum TaxID=439699 RepID=A0A2T0SJH5_9ACTN|nr:helix-turn-helix transcriptional regulator [Pseudosporangium ferrugineum]PRY33562.1 transcriptional regulator with XRE-family HTH domain [Pseudosporangium ferrugineum]BCJ56488.1 transcriptional regulator [Actinoplanes sp. NBRC 14428]
MAEDYTGARVRFWRLKRALSQKTLAGLAGVTQGYISQIESGLKEIDKRSTLVRLAEALQVSVADLTGQPYAPADAPHAQALAPVPEIRAALIGLAYLDLPAHGGKSLDQLRADVGRLAQARRVCDYSAASPMIAPLLRNLSAAVHDPRAAGRAEVLRLLTLTTHHTAFILKYLGFIDLSLAAAERGHLAASELGEPEWFGLAEYTRLHMLPPESRDVGRRLAAGTADRLQPHLGAPAVRQAYGMLQLTSAWAETISGNAAAARDRLDEAQDAAASLGEDLPGGGFAQMNFGPTNVAQWRASIAFEGGEAGRAVELSRAIFPQRIHSLSRRTQFHIEYGSALASTRRADGEALAQFVNAERVAPQRVRLSPVVRDTVGAMLRRARSDAGGTHLRELASRLGVA